MRCRADAASNPAQCSAAANLAVIEGMRSAESAWDEIRAALLVYVNRVFFCVVKTRVCKREIYFKFEHVAVEIGVYMFVYFLSK